MSALRPSTTSRRVSLGEVELHVAEAGPLDGPAVVLLHGFPEFSLGWRHQIPALADAGFRVLAPDQRGYNLSDKPRRLGAYRLDDLVGDVVALLDAGGIDRAALVGHDWGGLVAWWMAATRPERLRSLAILNAPHPTVMRRHLLRDRDQRRRSWYIFFFQLPWLPELWIRRRRYAVGVRSLVGSASRGTFTPADLEAYREAWSRPGALRGMLAWYRAALRRPPRGRPRPVTAPTLVLWGEGDRFLTSRLADASLELCTAGRLELLPEAGHWLHHEVPDRVNRSLLRHLRTTSVGA